MINTIRSPNKTIIPTPLIPIVMIVSIDNTTSANSSTENNTIINTSLIISIIRLVFFATKKKRRVHDIWTQSF